MTQGAAWTDDEELRLFVAFKEGVKTAESGAQQLEALCKAHDRTPAAIVSRLALLHQIVEHDWGYSRAIGRLTWVTFREIKDLTEERKDHDRPV